MKLYIIRHGETNWNKEYKLQGHADVELNENGRDLALKTAKAMADIPFTAAFSSPLKRAYETAEIILSNRNIPIMKDERLKEIGFGEYEGLCCKKECCTIPDTHFNNFFDAPERYKHPKDGESIEQLCERTGRFLEDLKNNQDYRKATVLIAAHGASIKGLLSSVMNRTTAEFWSGGLHKNCAVSILELRKGKFELIEEGKLYY